jgi:hypothetical protein
MLLTELNTNFNFEKIKGNLNHYQINIELPKQKTKETFMLQETMQEKEKD